MQDVVIGRKHHQHQHQTQPDSEPHFLGSLRQRPAANRLDRVEQKVTAVEQRHRKQVQQANRDREHGSQVNQRGKADSGDLPRYLGDPQRTADLVGGFPAGEDAADIGERAAHHEAGFLNAEP